MKNNKFFCLAACWALISASFSIAQLTNNPPELKLSGSEKKTKDIINKSDIIFIGQIITKGWVDAASPGMNSRGFTISIKTVLKGQVDSEVRVTLYVKNNGRIIEAVPQIGQSYIFFVKQGANQQLIVLKLLPPTDENIAKVKALIAAAPSSK